MAEHHTRHRRRRLSRDSTEREAARVPVHGHDRRLGRHLPVRRAGRARRARRAGRRRRPTRADDAGRGAVARAESVPPAGRRRSRRAAAEPPSPPRRRRADVPEAARGRRAAAEAAEAAGDAARTDAKPEPARREPTPPMRRSRPPRRPTPQRQRRPPAPRRRPAPAGRPGAGSCSSSRCAIAPPPPSIVQRLSGEGYPAFVVNPAASDADQVYKVQVGRYDDRSEAEQVATRLEKEEKFNPWILALALLSGALLALSFPKFGTPACAWLALTPLIVALVAQRRRAAALPPRASSSAWSTGAVYFCRHALLAGRDDDDVRRAAGCRWRSSPRPAGRLPVALSRRLRRDRRAVRAGRSARRAAAAAPPRRGSRPSLAGSTCGTAFPGSCSATAR